MLKRSKYIDLMVGIFVFVALVCISYLTIRLGKLDWFSKENYSILARFESVSGLKSGAFIEMAGVRIGQVESINLDHEDQVAIVKMKIQKDVKLSDDSIASIKTSGLIGDKFIKISPGGSDMILNQGDMIIETESAVDIEELISKYVFGGIEE